MTPCLRCGAPSKYEAFGTTWCGPHVAGAQLMEEGRSFRYAPFSFPEGEGHVFGEKVCVEQVPAGRVQGGNAGYRQFACEAPEAAVWRAMYEVHCYNVGLKKPFQEAHHTVHTPCSRAPGGCFYDASVPVQFFGRGPYIRGQQDRFGRPWCPRCLQAIALLEEARRLGYPAIKVLLLHGKTGPYQESSVRVLEDVGDWKEVVTVMSVFEVTYYLSLLQKGQYTTVEPVTEL